MAKEAHSCICDNQRSLCIYQIELAYHHVQRNKQGNGWHHPPGENKRQQAFQAPAPGARKHISSQSAQANRKERRAHSNNKTVEKHWRNILFYKQVVIVLKVTVLGKKKAGMVKISPAGFNEEHTTHTIGVKEKTKQMAKIKYGHIR